MSTERFRSVSKIIAVLNCFDSQNLKLSSSEIAKKLGIHRATALRMLEFLSEAQWIEKNQDSHKYSIGPALHMLGSLYLGTTDILKASEPIIRAINELTNEEIQIGIFNKGNIIFILKEETRRAFGFVHHHVGTVLPAYSSAIGLAILSELSEKEIDDLYPCE
jgi:DNA-binding IclR family transcriptional regulator